MKEYFTINNHFKKYLPIFMIMLSVIVLMGSSYALLRSSQKGENAYVMNVGALEVSFVDSKTNAFTFDNMIPMTDEEGMTIEQELEFTVKNTGTFPAEYDVYIEETSTNPEFKSVVKYISEKESFGYSDPKLLSDDKYVDQKNVLGVGEEVNYKVKVWLSEDADFTYMDKEFKAKIVVEARQTKTLLSAIKLSLAARENSYILEDEAYYISGAKDDNDPETTEDIDFNYVWYSGKLWRITAIYHDGTMKMITEDVITSISYGEDNKFYTDENTTSSVYQWLNQDFLPTLYNHENIIIENAVWNASPGNGEVSAKLPIEGQEEIIVNTGVGLLNSYEYYKSYQNTLSGSGYLNIGYNWWLINPDSSSSSYVWYVDSNGNGSSNSPSTAYGIRPTINLKSTIVVKSGSGTKEDPYIVGMPVDLFNYNSSVDYYTYNINTPGKYKIELWGAQGGGNQGGKGAYTSGEISLTQGETLYIYVGGRGPQNSSITNVGGYNGGGYSGNDSDDKSYGGGGATDVRLVDGTWNNQTSLASRIMVAAGGAGNTAGLTSASPAGGALTGGNATSSHSTFNKATYLAKGATQTAGGTAYQGTTRNGSFGYASQTNTTGWGGGGGGGYYGGGTGYGGTGSSGSSFISGYTGCVAIASSSSITARTGTNGATCANGTTDNLCSVHYSGKVFADTVMIAGNASMPSTTGGTETGHSGNGYAIITYLGE